MSIFLDPKRTVNLKKNVKTQWTADPISPKALPIAEQNSNKKNVNPKAHSKKRISKMENNAAKKNTAVQYKKSDKINQQAIKALLVEPAHPYPRYAPTQAIIPMEQKIIKQTGTNSALPAFTDLCEFMGQPCPTSSMIPVSGTYQYQSFNKDSEEDHPAYRPMDKIMEQFPVAQDSENFDQTIPAVTNNAEPKVPLSESISQEKSPNLSTETKTIKQQDFNTNKVTDELAKDIQNFIPTKTSQAVLNNTGKAISSKLEEPLKLNTTESPEIPAFQNVDAGNEKSQVNKSGMEFNDNDELGSFNRTPQHQEDSLKSSDNLIPVTQKEHHGGQLNSSHRSANFSPSIGKSETLNLTIPDFSHVKSTERLAVGNKSNQNLVLSTPIKVHGRPLKKPAREISSTETMPFQSTLKPLKSSAKTLKNKNHEETVQKNVTSVQLLERSTNKLNDSRVTSESASAIPVAINTKDSPSEDANGKTAPTDLKHALSTLANQTNSNRGGTPNQEGGEG